jgi:type IV secretory pathway VirB2 component (pilin)
VARRLLIAFVVAVALLLAAIGTRTVTSRLDPVWWLGLLPIAALLTGPRTRAVVVAAVVELVALVPLHAVVTLVRAARLEGG